MQARLPPPPDLVEHPRVREDIARVIMALRVEFAGSGHPVGQTIERIIGGNAQRFAHHRRAGRGAIPAGPPADVLAVAGIAAMEGIAIQIAGDLPHDEVVAERAMLGILGVTS